MNYWPICRILQATHRRQICNNAIVLCTHVQYVTALQLANDREFFFQQNRFDSAWSQRTGHAVVFTVRRHSSMLCSCHVLAIANVSVCLSVTPWHCVKTTHAKIARSSLSCPWRTLVSASVKLLRHSTGVTPIENGKQDRGRKNLRFLTDKSPHLNNGAI